MELRETFYLMCKINNLSFLILTTPPPIYHQAFGFCSGSDGLEGRVHTLVVCYPTYPSQ